jgi:hypothetical protein
MLPCVSAATGVISNAPELQTHPTTWPDALVFLQLELAATA